MELRCYRTCLTLIIVSSIKFPVVVKNKRIHFQDRNINEELLCRSNSPMWDIYQKRKVHKMIPMLSKADIRSVTVKKSCRESNLACARTRTRTNTHIFYVSILITPATKQIFLLHRLILSAWNSRVSESHSPILTKTYKKNRHYVTCCNSLAAPLINMWRIIFFLYHKILKTSQYSDWLWAVRSSFDSRPVGEPSTGYHRLIPVLLPSACPVSLPNFTNPEADPPPPCCRTLP
jgi:hypothetical protein